MIRNETRVQITRSPEDVFAFVADLCNEPKYVPNVLETAKITDGPCEVGSKYREVTQVIFGRKAVATYEITHYERPQKFAFRGTSGRSKFRGRWVLEATDDGTLAKFTAEAQLAFPMKLMEPAVRKSVAGTFEAMGRNLLRVLEPPEGTRVKPVAAKRQRAAGGAGTTASASASASTSTSRAPAGGKRTGPNTAPSAAKRQSRAQGGGEAQRPGPAAAKRSSRSRNASAPKKPNPLQDKGDGAGGTTAEGADTAGG